MRRFVLIASLALLAGCQTDTTPACGPSNCTGCCDSNGLCQNGAAPQACGELGGACSACAGNQLCQFGFCTQPASCTPTSCAKAQKNCGTVLDGCGGQLNCGTCEVSGESCGGSGTANVCGVGSCTPK